MVYYRIDNFFCQFTTGSYFINVLINYVHVHRFSHNATFDQKVVKVNEWKDELFHKCNAIVIISHN